MLAGWTFLQVLHLYGVISWSLPFDLCWWYFHETLDIYLFYDMLDQSEFEYPRPCPNMVAVTSRKPKVSKWRKLGFKMAVRQPMGDITVATSTSQKQLMSAPNAKWVITGVQFTVASGSLVCTCETRTRKHLTPPYLLLTFLFLMIPFVVFSLLFSCRCDKPRRWEKWQHQMYKMKEYSRDISQHSTLTFEP